MRSVFCSCCVATPLKLKKENDSSIGNDLDDFIMPAKKKAKSSSRFRERRGAPEIAQMVKGYTPGNTAKSTSWAFKVFTSWRAETSEGALSGNECPRDLLETGDVAKLNEWLPLFVSEVRRQDGHPYPPKRIHQILAGLQRYMLEKNPLAPKFLDTNDKRFHRIHGVCDTVYRELHQQGVGTSVRHAAVITAAEEDALWETGVIAITSPISLQHAVFYYVGKRFCIRGGEEQRLLGPSQFVRSHNPDCYNYVEHGSKNHSGGLKQLGQENKVVPCPAVPENIPKCLVFLLDQYIMHLPRYSFEKDIFYVRPKTKVPASPDEPWYENCPIGKNKLSGMVKQMFKEANISSDKVTNHSLRASGATAMFQGNIPEKIIQKTTGHRSLSALRNYERVSTEQYKAMSKVLVPASSDARPVVISDPSQVSATEASVPQSMVFDPSRMLGGFSNCSVGTLTININPAITVNSAMSMEREFDQVVSSYVPDGQKLVFLLYYTRARNETDFR